MLTQQRIQYLVFLALIGISQIAIAQSESHVYLSGELGLNLGDNLVLRGESTDQGSVCDPVINPDPTSRDIAGCPSKGTGWVSKFDKASGPLLSTAIGYAFDKRSEQNTRQLRVELEYLYRQTKYDQTSPIGSARSSSIAQDKLDNEIARAEERIGTVRSHSVFTNLYWDYHINSNVSPYLGFGLGWALTEFDNSRIWERNSDWMEIQTGIDLPNGDLVRQNLAGTISRVSTTNSGSGFQIQLLAGADFKWNEDLIWGIKARVVTSEAVQDTGGLDLLRSHEPPADYVAQRHLATDGFLAVGLYIKKRL